MHFKGEKSPSGKQYCRYCSWLCCGNGIWCSKHKREYSEQKVKALNHCKDFDFNPMDALGFDPEKLYKPKIKKESKYKQLSLFGGIEK